MKLSVVIVLGILTLIPTQVSAGCGSGFFSTNKKLSDYMKNVIVNGWRIPVYSGTLGSGASFSNLIIKYEASSSGVVETGKAISFEALNRATGYSYISYSFKGKFIDIPNVEHDLNTNYSHFNNGVKIKNVKIEVSAIGQYGNVVAKKIFELETGKNKLEFCAFNNIKENIKKIDVELKSYSFDYSFSTTRTWN